MTSHDDSREPEPVPAYPRLLAPALTILAYFDRDGAVLDRTDIARLTGFPVSIARRYLVMLTGLGYLSEDCDRALRRTGPESGPIYAWHNDGGTRDSAA